MFNVHPLRNQFLGGWQVGCHSLQAATLEININTPNWISHAGSFASFIGRSTSAPTVPSSPMARCPPSAAGASPSDRLRAAAGHLQDVSLLPRRASWTSRVSRRDTGRGRVSNGETRDGTWWEALVLGSRAGAWRGSHGNKTVTSRHGRR